MSARVAPLLVLAVLLAACGSDPAPAPPPPPAPAVAQADPAPAAAPEQPAAPATPEWSYTSVGKRDPFRSFLVEIASGGAGPRQRCTTPLGKFELEQMKLVAVVTGLEDPVAMVEAPSGVGYAVRRGACIGKNGGVVATVRSGEIVVAEWATRADGTRDRTQTVLSLPKEAALNLEE